MKPSILLSQSQTEVHICRYVVTCSLIPKPATSPWKASSGSLASYDTDISFHSLLQGTHRTLQQEVLHTFDRLLQRGTFYLPMNSTAAMEREIRSCVTVQKGTFY